MRLELTSHSAIDAEDESLAKWKASLGIAAGPTASDPSDPRRCIIQSLTLEVKGRSNIVIDLTAPGSVDKLKDKPFTIKEGAEFNMKAVFKVQHDVLSGLKMVLVIKRAGMTVGKEEEMLVGFSGTRPVPRHGETDWWNRAPSRPIPWTNRHTKRDVGHVFPPIKPVSDREPASL